MSPVNPGPVLPAAGGGQFYNALRAVRDVLRERPDVYLVNEGANALDITRNVVDMPLPRCVLDPGPGVESGHIRTINPLPLAFAAPIQGPTRRPTRP